MKALGQRRRGQLRQGGLLGVLGHLQGQLQGLCCAAEVSLCAQASFRAAMPWWWLWSLFLSLCGLPLLSS